MKDYSEDNKNFRFVYIETFMLKPNQLLGDRESIFEITPLIT